MNAKGVAVEFWPLEALTVDWVREHFGPGHYQAGWVQVDPASGGHKPVGKSRAVTIGNPNAVASRSGRQAPRFIGQDGFAQARGGEIPPERSLAPLPPEVIDRRVQAEQEITKMRLAAQREMFDERIAWEKKQADERLAALESRIDEIAQGGGDDDDEPGQWDWLRNLLEPLGPLIKQAVPGLLAKLASGGKP